MNNYLDLKRKMFLCHPSNVVFTAIVKRYNYTSSDGSGGTIENNCIALSIKLSSGESCVVSYGGISKTLSATGDAIFGKYNNVDDGTPDSGELIITGSFTTFTQFNYSISKSTYSACFCIVSIKLWGNDISSLENGSFGSSLSSSLTNDTFESFPKIPSKISIGYTSFQLCSLLTEASIAAYHIGNGAFINCTNLANAYLFPGIESIGDSGAGYAVFHGSKVTSLVIPYTVDDIINANYESQFYNLSSLSVDPLNQKYDSRGNCNAVIETATNTLISGCLKSTIPSSVTSIGTNAFARCLFSGITIPSSVTSIGASAFNGCTGLTSIIIPSSVTSIGASAFNGCTSIVSIAILSTTPPTLGYGAFNGNASGRIIYVPSTSVDTYKAASNWSTYADYIQAIPS